MKKLTITLGLSVAIICIASVALSAQARRNNRDQICVYENNNFTGWEQCFLPGEQIGDLGDHRNKVSSIRVFGEARAQAFMDRNFGGQALDVNSDLSDLAQLRMGAGPIAGNWNDKIESIRVTSRTAVVNTPPPPTPPPTPPPNTRDVYVTRDSRIDDRPVYRDERDIYRADRRYGRHNSVCVFDQPNYHGRYECFDSGEEVADLGRSSRWNDRISSIRIFGPARVTLYRDINFRGDRVTIDRDVPDLRRFRMNGSQSWDNQISSLDINGGRGHAYGRR